jgi:hypothetical protein
MFSGICSSGYLGSDSSSTSVKQPFVWVTGSSHYGYVPLVAALSVSFVVCLFPPDQKK